MAFSGLGKLVVTYVDTINNGAVPCLENAVTSLALLENSAAVQKAADHYSEKMTQKLSLPTDTFQELLEVHAACEKEAIAIFMEHSFKDENQEFQKNLVVTCLNSYHFPPPLDEWNLEMPLPATWLTPHSKVVCVLRKDRVTKEYILFFILSNLSSLSRNLSSFLMKISIYILLKYIYLWIPNMSGTPKSHS